MFLNQMQSSIFMRGYSPDSADRCDGIMNRDLRFMHVLSCHLIDSPLLEKNTGFEVRKSPVSFGSRANKCSALAYETQL